MYFSAFIFKNIKMATTVGKYHLLSVVQPIEQKQKQNHSKRKAARRKDRAQGLIAGAPGTVPPETEAYSAVPGLRLSMALDRGGRGESDIYLNGLQSMATGFERKVKVTTFSARWRDRPRGAQEKGCTITGN